MSSFVAMFLIPEQIHLAAVATCVSVRLRRQMEREFVVEAKVRLAMVLLRSRLDLPQRLQLCGAAIRLLRESGWFRENLQANVDTLARAAVMCGAALCSHFQTSVEASVKRLLMLSLTKEKKDECSKMQTVLLMAVGRT